MSVLVTGGTGFLGRRIVERLLAAGRPVTVLARKPAPDLEQRGVRFVAASLDDADAVRAACTGIETVFHTAAKVGVWGRYQDFYRTNVLGTRALLEGCRAHGVKRLVYTSTPERRLQWPRPRRRRRVAPAYDRLPQSLSAHQSYRRT